MKTEQKVKQIIHDQLGGDLKTVIEDATLVNDLAADSLDHVELTMTLEEEFGILIHDSAVEKFKTVGDVIKTVKHYLELQKD